jgi:hypothetical protein
MPRQGALIVWFFLAVLTAVSPVAAARDASPARQSLAQARAHKALEARARGYWIVERGEHFRLIARQFYPGDRARERQLSEELFARNPRAFAGGDKDRLRVGARLILPPELVRRDEGATSAPAAQGVPKTQPGAANAAGSAANATPEFDANPPAHVKPKSPEAAPYVDQLIGGAGAEPESIESIGEEQSVPGRRFISAEYRAEAIDPPGGGRGLEQGVQIHLRRETLNYGDLYLDAGVRDTRPAPGDASVERRNGASFTLYQVHFPIGEAWLADSVLGVARTPPNSLINSSYRIFLPTSQFSGATTVVSDNSQSFIAYAGRLGRLEGSAIQTFDPTPGTVGGIGYTRRFGAWSVAGETISLRGDPQVRDHDAASVAAEYGTIGALVHHKAQVVADSDSNLGAWFDGDVTSGRVRQRFGAFQLDPNLAWGDGQLANDQRGAYWRGDYRLLKYTLSGGADLGQTDIRDDPSRAATRSGSAYGTFSLRIDRNLSVGAGITYQQARIRFTDSPRASTVSGNAYASWNNPWGLSRFDLSAFRATASGQSDDDIDTLSWSQDWPPLGPVHLTSTLTRSQELAQGVRTRRSSLGLSAHGAPLSDVSWDASVVYGRVESPQGAENDFNVSATATWQVARNWSALAQISINTFDPVPPLPGSEALPVQRDKRFLLGVRYEAASGTPYQSLGLQGGTGSGRLTGIVFFDDNGDGLRQPTERGAPNVTVYLDGRFPVTTDPQGRFNFPAVTPGSHALRIPSESLPLPWTFSEDHPPVTNVPLRGEASVEIPLTRIRP